MEAFQNCHSEAEEIFPICLLHVPSHCYRVSRCLCIAKPYQICAPHEIFKASESFFSYRQADILL